MRKLRGQLSFSNVIACVALFVALGGVALAATQLPKNSVGTKQLKKGAVTSEKVKDHSLQAADFAGPLPAGPQGERGSAGAPGAPGEAGKRGPSDAYYAFNNNALNNAKTLSLAVPEGSYAVTASMVAANSDMANWARITCYLESLQDETAGHSGVALVELGPAYGPAAAFYATAPAHGVMSFGAGGGTIEYACTRAEGTAAVALYQARITALQVETLH